MTTRILTSITARPDQFGAFVAQDWSGTDGLIAGWSVAFGPVTRLLFLQAVEGGVAPAVPVVPPDLAAEGYERDWLREVHSESGQADGITMIELRTYDTRPSMGARFLELMLGALRVRERHSRNVGIWDSVSGRLGRVRHMWGYRDMAERDRVRAALREDKDWQAYIATILPMLQALDSTILTPLPRC